jgi:N-acetylmuramoyl-L-alanine amidase
MHTTRLGLGRDMVVVAAVIFVGVPTARADPPPTGLHTPEPEDHHHRPPEYDDPTLAVPPASGAAPDYPLAAAFVPADPTNYTPGGIVSYDYVVVHTMQGYYAGSISWFQNPVSDVSAHYCMRAEDGAITQMVHDDDRAWHVGSSNSVALGIEHEGFVDDASWYTWETYLSSARLARWLCETHEIPVDRDHIVGHVELPNQTHTDPGPYWDWDLYMALVHDVVPAGEIQGVVVDRSQACTVTANADTWVKATLEDADALADDERCMIPAGTPLTVLHASGDMVGHVRLTMDADDSACAEPLAETGFVVTSTIEGLCDPASLAAVGATVRLDGGTEVPVDAEGRFTFEGVAPGAHTLDVVGEGFVDGMAPLDVDVYPGARVIVALDPVPTGSESGGEQTGGPATTGDGEGGGGTTAAETGDDLPGDDPDPDSGSGVGGGALPPGFGDDDGSGCGCTQGDRTAPWALSLALLLGWRRRSARPQPVALPN